MTAGTRLKSEIGQATADMKRRKLLFITSQLPYPPFGGGTSTSWNFIRFLSEHFDTSMATILKWDDPKNEAAFRARVKLERYFSLELNVERTAGTVARSYLKGVPINLLRNYHPELKRIIHQWLEAGGFDFVFVDHYEMFQYVPDGLDVRAVLHEHNAEFVMWERYASASTSPLKKLVTRLESKRIFQVEKRFCERADLVLANPNDQEVLTALTSGKSRIEKIIPCGEDFMLDWPDLQWSAKEESLLYVGSLGWEANVDGLLWFLEEGWPTLKARKPEVRFYIVGGKPDPRIVSAAEGLEDVVLTGFVDDLETYYSKCRVFLTPLRFGSGVKLKVMNAMFRGIPVVTTAIGAEGMNVESGTHLLCGDTMSEFVDNAVILLEDQTTWTRLRDHSRSLTAAEFSWKTQHENIKAHILSLEGPGAL